MKTNFSFSYETSESVINILHLISSIVSNMTLRHDCLLDFENHISSIKLSLSCLEIGAIDSLTFGFRVVGFDYSSTKNYNSDYRKDKGDLVVKIICFYDYDTFRLEYISLY